MCVMHNNIISYLFITSTVFVFCFSFFAYCTACSWRSSKEEAAQQKKSNTTTSRHTQPSKNERFIFYSNFGLYLSFRHNLQHNSCTELKSLNFIYFIGSIIYTQYTRCERRPKKLVFIILQ